MNCKAEALENLNIQPSWISKAYMMKLILYLGQCLTKSVIPNKEASKALCFATSVYVFRQGQIVMLKVLTLSFELLVN